MYSLKLNEDVGSKVTATKVVEKCTTYFYSAPQLCTKLNCFLDLSDLVCS